MHAGIDRSQTNGDTAAQNEGREKEEQRTPEKEMIKQKPCWSSGHLTVLETVTHLPEWFYWESLLTALQFDPLSLTASSLKAEVL